MHYRTAFAPLILMAATVGFGPCATEKPPQPMPDTVRTAPAQPSAAALPHRKQQTLTVTARMKEHFAQGDTLRRALIAGNLPAAKSAANWLASDEWTPNLRAAWKPHLAAIQSTAKVVNEADGSRAAALAFGDLANACASCHTAVGGPKLAPDADFPKDSASAMSRHAWAVDRMWWGLFTPSDAAWLSGAEALSGAPLVASDVPDVDAMAQSTYAIAQRARSVDKALRGRAFGELLATCGSCHERSGVSLALEDATLPTTAVRH